jgi:protein-tyrosine-phosphatase
MAKKRVLFICSGNSARSQMAQALMRRMAGDHFEVHSAGTEPRDAVHRDALAVLAEHGIDADGLKPKPASMFTGQSFDYVITVCDRVLESCPAFPGADVIHWSFPDPTAVEDDAARRREFESLFRGLSQRIRLLTIVSERS